MLLDMPTGSVASLMRNGGVAENTGKSKHTFTQHFKAVRNRVVSFFTLKPQKSSSGKSQCNNRAREIARLLRAKTWLGHTEEHKGDSLESKLSRLSRADVKDVALFISSNIAREKHTLPFPGSPFAQKLAQLLAIQPGMEYADESKVAKIESVGVTFTKNYKNECCLVLSCDNEILEFTFSRSEYKNLLSVLSGQKDLSDNKLNRAEEFSKIKSSFPHHSCDVALTYLNKMSKPENPIFLIKHLIQSDCACYDNDAGGIIYDTAFEIVDSLSRLNETDFSKYVRDNNGICNLAFAGYTYQLNKHDNQNRAALIKEVLLRYLTLPELLPYTGYEGFVGLDTLYSHQNNIHDVKLIYLDGDSAVLTNTQVVLELLDVISASDIGANSYKVHICDNEGLKALTILRKKMEEKKSEYEEIEYIIEGIEKEIKGLLMQASDKDEKRYLELYSKENTYTGHFSINDLETFVSQLTNAKALLLNEPISLKTEMEELSTKKWNPEKITKIIFANEKNVPQVHSVLRSADIYISTPRFDNMYFVEDPK